MAHRAVGRAQEYRRRGKKINFDLLVLLHVAQQRKTAVSPHYARHFSALYVIKMVRRNDM
jgi:hypothetical protein